jgi:hypothetical protein
MPTSTWKLLFTPDMSTATLGVPPGKPSFSRPSTEVALSSGRRGGAGGSFRFAHLLKSHEFPFSPIPCLCGAGLAGEQHNARKQETPR